MNNSDNDFLRNIGTKFKYKLKIKRAEDFLKYVRDILKQNPDAYFDENSFYGLLTQLGLKKNDMDEMSEYGKGIDIFFNTWIDEFRDDPNCNVFVDENWNYFCQFCSKDGKTDLAPDHLKVYIPLDYKHIKRGAYEIFKFLSRENIPHRSKIGSHVRFDDIVIRLINPEDVEKLLSFVKGNSYIMEGLLPANPFAFNKDGVALACDGGLSYNLTVASLITKYLYYKENKNQLNTVSLMDFYKYVEWFYTQCFVSNNYNIVDEFYQEFERRDCTINCPQRDRLIENYKSVIKLIINSIKEDFTLADYFRHYKDCVEKEKSYIQSKDKSVNEDDRQHNPVYNNMDEKQAVATLQKILMVMLDKYGYQIAKRNIEDYISTGDPKYLTRDFNIREQVYNSNFRDIIYRVLQGLDISLSDYLDSLAIMPDPQFKEIYVEQAIIETYKKYEAKYKNGESKTSGKAFVIAAIKTLIEFGSYDGFTRDNNARYNLMANVSKEDMIRIIESKIGFKLNNMTHNVYLDNYLAQYITSIIEKNISNKM